MVLKRCLLMLNDRILVSSVDTGRPSLAAAPRSPETRPLVSVNAASIVAFSFAWAASLSVRGGRGDGGDEVSQASQLSSTENSSVSQTMIERSITFCSSRMFPGQGYD